MDYHKTMDRLKKILVKVKEAEDDYDALKLKVIAARIGIRYDGQMFHTVNNMVLRILRA